METLKSEEFKKRIEEMRGYTLTSPGKIIEYLTAERRKMEILEKSIKLSEELSSSDIFKILQDISAEHCSMHQLSMDNLRKHNLIWVVVRQYLEIQHYPEAGETVILKSWPGNTRHGMFPRFYVMEDEKGEPVLKGSAIWTIVDANTRTMINPQSYGLELEGLVTGEECALPSVIKKHELKNTGSFTVPPEYIDANRHMNNTRYYDAVENCIGAELKGRKLKESLSEYAAEAVLGEEVTVSWDKIDGAYFVNGDKQGKVFRMKLIYE